MELPSLEQLAEEWEEEADRVRDRYGHEELAQICETHAAELRTRIRQQLDEKLTLQQAAEESGYSVSHLQHLVADGELPNAGKKGRPRIRRGDLPVKDCRESSSGERTGVSAGPRSASCTSTPEEVARDLLS